MSNSHQSSDIYNSKILPPNSVGHGDSHESRRERNETPRSSPKLAESNQFPVCLTDMLVSFRE